jgi:hypothetical protein
VFLGDLAALQAARPAAALQGAVFPVVPAIGVLSASARLDRRRAHIRWFFWFMLASIVVYFALRLLGQPAAQKQGAAENAAS